MRDIFIFGYTIIPEKRFYYNDISKFIPDLFQNCPRNSQRDN
ncbi:hypothetical protein M140_2748 [Bacteroides fragilis str. S38L3]|nr:hypothetical protein M140_2748 [Bacteroides fragilis str. S38L3]